MGWAEQVSRLQDHATRTFGERGVGLVLWRPAAGGTYQVRGIFRAAHVALDGEAEAGISETEPRLGVKVADLPAPPLTEDQVEVPEGGTLYDVIDVQEDGEGMADLMLHEVVT